MDGVLIKIAFRNLRQHMTKTLIIGILITLGITILVVGYSFMDTIKAGIEKNYIENYTGNIFIAPSALKDPSLIVSPEAFQSAPKTIPEFNQVQTYVESLPQVTGTTGQINGVASLKWGELGEGFSILFGVDSDSYQELFPNGVKLLEGEFLTDGQEGIVLSKLVVEILEETSGEKIAVGDQILLTSINTVSGTKIREVTVRGIHDFGDAAFDLSFISFIDEANLRIMNGLILNAIGEIDLTEEEEATLGGLSEDDLFGSDFSMDLISDEGLFDTSVSFRTDEDWDLLLGDTTERAYLNETDKNAWNFLLVKIADSEQASKVVKTLNKYFSDNGIDATAYEWLVGAGMSARLADTLGILFNVLILIVAVVAVIIIMNTLVISVSERYGEIGTMRAIGAQKSFVRKMISLETLMITLVFGFIGVLLGVIVLLIFRAIGIEATNQFLQILLGGGVFIPRISLNAIFTSVLMVSFVGIIASLYPVSVALKISPLEAMNKG
jgi:putative ABC transport system permease protein